MIKSEYAGKKNIQRVRNNIQVMDPNIKVMDINHFCYHKNSLTTALPAYCMIMSYLMHQFFKAYKVYKDIEFRYYLT